MTPEEFEEKVQKEIDEYKANFLKQIEEEVERLTGEKND